MAYMEYDNQQQTAFLELAKEIGYARAMRELGYPKSWATADKWAKARGIVIEVDALKARAKAFHEWYETEDQLLVAQEGVKRIYEKLTEEDLDADSQKKLAEAYQKYVNTWLTLQGKANSISESRALDSHDVELLELINEQKMRNSAIEDAANPTTKE